MANRVSEVYCQSPNGFIIPSNCHCPITNTPCDGGGNRHQTALDPNNLPTHIKEFAHVLSSNFPDVVGKIQCAICSIKLSGQANWNVTPWIVCPRRILNFPPSESQIPLIQALTSEIRTELKEGEVLKVWSEVKLKQTSNNGLVFDYRFDYVISCVGVDGYPKGSPLIIEVMTSSTSGSNKAKRTDIPSCFIDVLRGENPTTPGINYRQVWGRMGSQLIAKSDVARQWGGRTIWVLQENLVKYISVTTGLDLNEFETNKFNHVNFLVTDISEDATIAPLSTPRILSGPIHSELGTMSDLMKVGYVPELKTLHSRLAEKESDWIIDSGRWNLS